MAIKRLLRKLGYDMVVHRSYHDYVLRKKGIRTVIDIGANTGAFSREMRSMFPHAQILAFEPLAECYKKLVEEMASDKNFKAWNTALGETAGDTVMHHSSFHPSSSLLPMSELHKSIYPKSKDSTEEQIVITCLDDALAGEKLDVPVFIKMDVQGFEDKVIAGGPGILSLASVVQIETSFVSLYENQPLFGDIHERMRVLGFAYRGESARHYDKAGILIYQDSIFEKAL